MEQLTIEGGRPLKGEAWVGGAKNAALPALAAAVLAADATAVVDVPRLRDVDVMVRILQALGADVREAGGAPRSLEVDAGTVTSTDIPDVLMRQMRSSIFLMGPLLARFGEVRLTQPGGCSIGPRPIDLHLAGLRRLGAEISEEGPIIHARAQRLKGADVMLKFPSVGATENTMMAATLAEGSTTIRNAAREPEIVDLAAMLSGMGARIQGAGSDVVRIEGVARLHGLVHRVIPDRAEAGTLLFAIAATGGDAQVLGARADHLDAVVATARDMGCTVELSPDRIRLRGPARLHPVDVRTQPYPGFPTDLQNPVLAALLRAQGTSLVTEAVFENRFQVAEEMRRMGAQLYVDGRVAIVRGVPRLTGAWVEANELRGGAALIIAALSAEGVSRIDGLVHVDRGYERIEEKLTQLGARAARVGARDH